MLRNYVGDEGRSLAINLQEWVANPYMLLFPHEMCIRDSSNGEPNWSYIPTKGKSSKTHAEFVSEIKELARAATTANKTEYEYISRQVLGLRAEYLSDVAPDRKQLYEQAKNLSLIHI